MNTLAFTNTKGSQIETEQRGQIHCCFCFIPGTIADKKRKILKLLILFIWSFKVTVTSDPTLSALLSGYKE
jgi:hypothetical protein